MEVLQNLGFGLMIALTPINLIACTLGGIAGIIVGAMPGIGPVAGVALLLPLTFKMDPTTAIITLAALYYGNMFGSSISAILINIPGDAPSIMTALDGYQMSKKGRAGQALFMSFFSSFIAGLVGALLLAFLGTVLAEAALEFGPPEFAALIFLAMTLIGCILGDSVVKGLFASALGLLLSSIGTDSMMGLERMTFGSIELIGGVPFIAFIIGIFGLTQVIQTLANPILDFDKLTFPKITYKSSMLSKEEWKRSWPAIWRGTFVGFFAGTIPGCGVTTATFISYLTEKRVSKHPEEFGKGAIEGLASAEAANNSASIGAFAPLLCLGIPGSSTTAILLGGLMMWGLQPGPLLMVENKEFAWGLIASMITGDIILAIICFACLPLLGYILKVPNSILMPTIVVISIVSAYCLNNSVFDIGVMTVAGLLGYILERHSYPLAPLAMTLILGPTFETAVRQSFKISQGDISIFFTRPISLGMIVAAVVLVVSPIIYKTIKNNKKIILD